MRLWRQAARAVKKEYGELDDECRRYFIIRCLIDGQVKDVVETTEERIAAAGVASADDVRLEARPLARYSAARRTLNLELRKYLYQNLYFNPVVHEPNARAVRCLEQLFHHLLDHPDEVGDLSRKRAPRVGWRRAVCDYLAGMTDRYLMLEHQRLLGQR